MVEMARAARIPSIRAEYNDFLYATIGAEANGTSLSVLSAMARMNLDPWREAASLAELPGKAAANRLASLIAALPGRPSAPDESGMTAARLIKLLPQHGLLSPALPQPHRLSIPPYLLGVIKVLSSRGAIYVVMLLIALTLGAQWFAARRPPPAVNAQPPVSETTARPDVPLSH
jgi:hypothetical protein